MEAFQTITQVFLKVNATQEYTVAAIGVRFVYVYPFENSCYAWHIIYEERKIEQAEKGGK